RTRRFGRMRAGRRSPTRLARAVTPRLAGHRRGGFCAGLSLPAGNGVLRTLPPGQHGPAVAGLGAEVGVGRGAGVVPALSSQVVMTCRLAEPARTGSRGEGSLVLRLLH